MTALSAEQVSEAKHLFEGGSETTAQIGARFGVSKNTIIGLARRRGWISGNKTRGGPRGPEPSTLFQRMDALEAMMEAMLKENPPGFGRIKGLDRDHALRA